jgi:hypothetical protein
MPQQTSVRNQTILLCCVTMIAALYVIGLASGTGLRHVVQTLPLWLGAILGYLGARMAGWVALPLFLIWLALMILIWLYLLGWAQVIQGNFAPTEIAMTLLVGVSSILGMARCMPGIQSTSRLIGAVVFLLSGGFQVAMLDVSFLPKLASR